MVFFHIHLTLLFSFLLCLHTKTYVCTQEEKENRCINLNKVIVKLFWSFILCVCVYWQHFLLYAETMLLSTQRYTYVFWWHFLFLIDLFTYSVMYWTCIKLYKIRQNSQAYKQINQTKIIFLKKLHTSYVVIALYQLFLIYICQICVSNMHK